MSLADPLVVSDTPRLSAGAAMHTSERIAVVGGGPAGAFAAAELARFGCKVVLFDEKLAWEKPCGGGLTDKAIAHWPFLREAQAERNWISHCQLIAPSGRKVSFPLDRQIAIFSRKVLNGLLIEKARQAGTQVCQERVIGIERTTAGWSLRTTSKSYGSDFVVLATGARNSFGKQFSRRLGPENFMMAAGYYIPGTHQTVQIKFLKGLHGYIWVFPRADHFSVGICGRMQGMNTASLRRILHDSVAEFGLTLDGGKFYAHIIPSLTVNALQRPFSGDGWAMIGDAAGFVDAITGEGIYYSLRSAEQLANALQQNAPEKYPGFVREDFLPELEHASRIAGRFYAGDWMGDAVIERMVQLTARSTRFRELMRDLFAGTQEYSDLRERVYRNLPRIAAEAVVSTVWTPPSDMRSRAAVGQQ